jgi:hypothetical protein
MNRPLTRKLLPWRVLYWASILLFTAAASHWIGWPTAFLGMEAGLVFAFPAYLLKYRRSERAQLTFYVAFFTWLLAQTNYSLVYITRYGLEKQGVITEIKNPPDTLSGIDSVYYRPCVTVTGYPGEDLCWPGAKVGDTVYFHYLPQLPCPVHLYPSRHPKIDELLTQSGGFLFGSFLFAYTILTTWLFSLFRAGFPLVAQKIESEKQKEIKKEVSKGVPQAEAEGKRRLILDVLNHLYYGVGCAVFALFILALLKNLYWNIPFKYVSIVATTIAIVLLLATSWGERLFVFSNHILLSTNYYRVYAVIKQIAKILLYLKFGHLLFQSLTQPNKSFADILQEFVNKFFEVNAKSLWEFFVSMFK